MEIQTLIILKNDENKIKCSKNDLRESYICLKINVDFI